MTKTAYEKAMKILSKSHVGTMATIENNKPHTRYMTFFYENNYLYTVTSKQTHKAQELQKNPHTHILIGYDGKGFGDAFLEIEGTVEESHEMGLKEKIWNKFLEAWFEGVDDPDMLVLKITPTNIRLMNEIGKQPEQVILHG